MFGFFGGIRDLGPEALSEIRDMAKQRALVLEELVENNFIQLTPPASTWIAWQHLPWKGEESSTSGLSLWPLQYWKRRLWGFRVQAAHINPKPPKP